MALSAVWSSNPDQDGLIPKTTINKLVPVVHLFSTFKGERETLALFQIAIIPSLKALWKIDLNVEF